MNARLIIILILVGIKAEAQTSALAISDSLYALGNYSEAISVLNSVQNKTESVKIKLAKANEVSGNWKESLDGYKEILKKNPNRILTAVDYGDLLLKSGEHLKADSLFQNLAEKYPENATFQYKLGIIKEHQQDSLAINNFRKAVELDSTHQAALYKVAKNELENRNYPQAERFSVLGLNENPNNTSLLSILAQTYYNQEKYHKALENFKEISELGQGNEFVYSKLGMCYYRTFQYQKALESFKKCLEYEDRNSDTHYNLGKLYAQTGDLKNSEAEFLMALLIKKQPVDSEYLSLALTYKLQEDYAKMLQYTQEAISENPLNERAWYEKAVAGDNYYAELQSKINLYQDYLNRFENKGNNGIISLARNRLSDLKKEQHLKGENNGN